MQTKTRCLVLLACVSTLLLACSRLAPEQRLRQAIEQMQAAVEEGDQRGVLRHVAADFVGDGGMDREQLQRMLRAQMLLNTQIGVHPGPLQIELQQGSATVRCTVALTGGSGRMLPERGRVLAITSGWREVDGQWQLYHARWEDARE